MNGVKNGITIVSRYAGEALNSLYEKTLDPVLDKIASIDFANSYFSNPAIPEAQKFSAFRRNILRNEDAFLGLGGYPTGEKHEGGLKEILVLLGLLAAAGGGMAIAKKYDLGMDDISATIAYLEAKAFGASSEITGADSLNPLAPTPAPTVKAKNATVKETPRLTPQEIAKQRDYGPFDEMKINSTANGTEQVTVYIQPGIKGNVTKMLKLMENYAPKRYNETAPFLERTTIIQTTGVNYNAAESNEIALNEVVITGVGTV